MSYNHYKFLLENYRQRTDGLFAADPGVVAVRKALHQSYQHEASRMKERHRQEMARQKRQQIENERLIKIKISELKKKEREISKRYEHAKTRITQVKRNVDYFPKISYASPTRPVIVRRGHLLPDRNYQRGTESRYEYETYRIPKGRGKEKIVFLPASVDVSALNVSDNEDSDLVKLDRLRETQFPPLPVDAQKSTTKNIITEQLSQPAANAENSVERSLQTYEYRLHKYLNDFSSMQCIQKPEYGVERVFTNKQPLNPSASPMKPDFTHDLIRYYQERERFHLQPSAEHFSGRQKPEKYEMLLLDSLDSRPEQIRVDQVDPQDPTSTYDILAIEEDGGVTANSQVE